MSAADDFTKLLAAKVARSIDENITSFILKVEGRMPPLDEIVAHGHFVILDDEQRTERIRFFIWKKHNVLAIRFGYPVEHTDAEVQHAAEQSMMDRCAIVFCHLFPDDWPEALANHIASLP